MKSTIRIRTEYNRSNRMFGIDRDEFWKMWVLSHDQFEYREDFARDLENKILFRLGHNPEETEIKLYSYWYDEEPSLYEYLFDYRRYCSHRKQCAKFFDTTVYHIEVLPERDNLSQTQLNEIEKMHNKNWFENRKLAK
jgi:hypothetical protein